MNRPPAPPPEPEDGHRQLDFEISGGRSGDAAGLLITFEGGEGSGKTTQASLLEDYLISKGVNVLSVRDPGSTHLGNYVRAWIKRWRDTTPLAEALLFEAARAQLMASAISPALKRGSVVICDRFTDSTLAYQGYGREFNKEIIRQLNEIATAGRKPDLTVLLEIHPVTAKARVVNPKLDAGGAEASGFRVDPESERRFEMESTAFHNRVASGYGTLAGMEPHRWLVVDATQSPEAVAAEIRSRVDSILEGMQHAG